MFYIIFQLTQLNLVNAQGEMRKFINGDYILLHDMTRQKQTRPTLDLVLHLMHTVSEKCEGDIHYIVSFFSFFVLPQ